MKSKLILLNMVISAMFIFQSISTLVNREDSPTLSKTYLSGPDYYTTYFVSRTTRIISGPFTGPYQESQDHKCFLVYRTPGFSGPQEQARTDMFQPYPLSLHQEFTDSTCTDGIILFFLPV